jgi:hypothetical protein
MPVPNAKLAPLTFCPCTQELVVRVSSEQTWIQNNCNNESAVGGINVEKKKWKTL